jgi:hypothetical protein
MWKFQQTETVWCLLDFTDMLRFTWLALLAVQLLFASGNQLTQIVGTSVSIWVDGLSQLVGLSLSMFWSTQENSDNALHAALMETILYDYCINHSVFRNGY